MTQILNWYADDITFCADAKEGKCTRIECFRHPVHIRNKTDPHSYGNLKGTIYCELKDKNTSEKE